MRDKKYQNLVERESKMKCLEATKKILRIEILRDRQERKLYLSKKWDVEEVFHKFNMQSVKPVSIP